MVFAGEKNGNTADEKIYFPDERISSLLADLKETLQASQVLGSTDAHWLDEQFHVLTERILWIHHEARRGITCMLLLKKSTQLEIYRRLNAAKSFMEDCLSKDISLEDFEKKKSMPQN